MTNWPPLDSNEHSAWASEDILGERLTLQPFHYQVQTNALNHPCVKDVDNVGMADLLQNRHFTLKAFLHLFVVAQVFVEQLDRNLVTGTAIFSTIHGTKTTFGQCLNQAIRTDVSQVHCATGTV